MILIAKRREQRKKEEIDGTKEAKREEQRRERMEKLEPYIEEAREILRSYKERDNELVGRLDECFGSGCRAGLPGKSRINHAEGFGNTCSCSDGTDNPLIAKNSSKIVSFPSVV